MGPKGKPNTPKSKQLKKTETEKNIEEEVTQVQKEFFEFTLSDIEKKLERINAREEELSAGTGEIEEKIEELKKEKGAVITEHEQLLVAKEEEKVQKREEMCQLSEDIKIRIEKHKERMEELKNNHKNTVEKIKEKLEEQEEEIRILEDHKQNKDIYAEKLEELEIQMNEAEMQHKRNLFEIEQKWETIKVRVKRELQSRLLQLSISFRQKNQKKIGKPYHRATLENKAIQNALVEMQKEILEYQEKCGDSKQSMLNCRNQKNKKQLEKDKTIARTVIQLYVIKTLKSERVKLWEKLKTFEPVVVENKNLIKKFRMVSQEVENKSINIEQTKQNIEDKIEETNVMKEATSHLKKSTRRLQVLIRNSLKITEETTAVRLIPMGMMEEEKYLTNEAKIRLFKKRRDSVFAKKGKILQYLFEFLSKAQLTEDDKKLLQASSESIGIENINFSAIYGKAILLEELEKTESEMEGDEEKRRKGPLIFPSLTSLPRSLSAIIIPEKPKSESESYEGEFGEYGEYDEEEEMLRVERGETELFDDFGLQDDKDSQTETDEKDDKM